LSSFSGYSSMQADYLLWTFSPPYLFDAKLAAGCKQTAHG
jgi:hypothetical protein